MSSKDRQCSKTLVLLSEEDIQKELLEFGMVDVWRLESRPSSESGNVLVLSFEAKNFKSAIEYLNQIAEIAERIGHHPDFELYEYRKVRVKVWTHAVGGVTAADLKLVKEISAIKTVLRNLQLSST